MIVFDPVYYLGWYIQPTLEGYYVCMREDSSKPCLARFDDVEEAKAYIEEKTNWGRT